MVLSNPCFEVWLHCHFDDFMPRQFITCDECVAELQKAWIRHGVSADPYKKGDPKIYRKLSGRLLAAIAAAKHLRQVHHKTVKRTADANASTDVYALVEYLQGVVPE